MIRSVHTCTEIDASVPASAVAGGSAFFADILKQGIDLHVRVTGGSMAPFLKGGETVTIRKVPSSSLLRGDLILFRVSGDALLLHRLIKKDERNGQIVFWTRGDNLGTYDVPVSAREVLGRVVQVERTDRFGNRTTVDMNSPVQKTRNSARAVAGLIRAEILRTAGFMKRNIGRDLI